MLVTAPICFTPGCAANTAALSAQPRTVIVTRAKFLLKFEKSAFILDPSICF
jgi:hypothetical protein